jgi:hypothetical protein
MNKSLTFILLLILMCSLINAQEGAQGASQGNTQGNYEEIEEGVLEDKPVIYNGVVIQGTGTEVGNNKIDGEVTLPEMGNIKVKDVKDFSSTADGFKGTADYSSTIAGHRLGKGSKFSYNKNTKELQIENGGTILDDKSHVENMKVVGKNGGKIKEDGTIVLPKGSSLTTSTDYTVPSLMGHTGKTSREFSFTAKQDNAQVKTSAQGYDVKGNAIAIGGAGDTVDINGGAKIFVTKGELNVPSKITRVDFENTGSSKYTHNLRSEGFAGPVKTTYSNQIRDPITNEPKNANVAIVLDGSSVNENNYDGVIYERNSNPFFVANTKTDIGVKGQASVALGDEFRYYGLSQDTETQIRTNRGYQMLTVDHPKNPSEDDLIIANVYWGDKKGTLSTHNGRLYETWDTGSLFAQGGTTVMELKSEAGESVSEDGQIIKSYGTDIDNVAITYRPLSLIAPEKIPQFTTEQAREELRNTEPVSMFERVPYAIFKILGYYDEDRYVSKFEAEAQSTRTKAIESFKDWPSE